MNALVELIEWAEARCESAADDELVAAARAAVGLPGVATCGLCGRPMHLHRTDGRGCIDGLVREAVAS